jgi:hypothetical protein
MENSEKCYVLFGREHGNIFISSVKEFRKDWYVLIKACESLEEAQHLIDLYYRLNPFAKFAAILSSTGQTLEHTENCVICTEGKHDPQRWSKSIREQFNGQEFGIREIMEATGTCFNCAFWIEKLFLHYFTGKSVIVDGSHYTDRGKSSQGREFLGFCGREFKYKKENKMFETNNMWHQGKIPQRFRLVLEDNAVFL